MIGIKQFAHKFNFAIFFRRSTMDNFSNFSQNRILCGPPQLWQPLLLNEFFGFFSFFVFKCWRKSTTTDFILRLRPILFRFKTINTQNESPIFPFSLCYQMFNVEINDAVLFCCCLHLYCVLFEC